MNYILNSTKESIAGSFEYSYIGNELWDSIEATYAQLSLGHISTVLSVG